MKLLKKLAMMLLAVGMVASVAACGSTEGGGENSTETSQTSEVKEVGQMLTETEFEAAVQTLYSQTNLVINMEWEEEGGKVAVSGFYAFADGKAYTELTYVENGATTKWYGYAGAVEGKYYEWESTDKNVWEYVEAEAEDATPNILLEYVFSWCGFDYCTFNNKTEMMEFTGLNAPSVGVKVVNGKIVAFRYEDIDGNWLSATITYGGAVVGELPALD